MCAQYTNNVWWSFKYKHTNQDPSPLCERSVWTYTRVHKSVIVFWLFVLIPIKHSVFVTVHVGRLPLGFFLYKSLQAETCLITISVSRRAKLLKAELGNTWKCIVIVTSQSNWVQNGPFFKLTCVNHMYHRINNFWHFSGVYILLKTPVFYKSEIF